MTARRVASALGGALCLVAVWSLAGSASAGDKPPTTVGVRNGASEFSFTLSRTKVKPGPAIIQYQNTGEDPHDVKILRRGARRELAIGVTEPGLTGSVTIERLKPESKYDLWCSLEGHREAGMEATLKVAKKKRKR
ncbi:MAG TPA: hypothetical protein VD766_09095 [Solirubrobacterales bacterium]|nr:hypothetical protein [Solirubrobacterales bacterium]